MVAMPNAKSRPRKTAEDYLALPDGVQVELIHGELYATPLHSAMHQRVTGRLHRYIDEHAVAGGLGKAFIPLDVRLGSGDIVRPDVLFVGSASMDVDGDWVQGAPDIVVEVVSPPHAERDRLVKRDLYARNRIPTYWIVDPEDESVELLKLGARAYKPEAYFQGEAVLTTALLPGLQIPLQAVFA